MTTRPVSPRSAVAFAAAGFGFLAILSALQLYVFRVASGENVELMHMVYGLMTWLPWAAVAPAILLLNKRWDFRKGRRLASTVVHLLFWLVIHTATAYGLIRFALALWGTGERIPTIKEIWQQVFSSSRVQLSLLAYFLVLGIDRGLAVWNALRERELQASRLEAQAARARLEALAARLQPHFLFNALHTVGALTAEDPARARAVLVQLGDLLRDVLATPNETDVTLEEELQLLDRYLGIELIRFADRLRVEVHAGPETLALRVPRFLLQPLAENALKHGLAPLASGGTLRIEATRRGDRLRLRVWNDGVPLAATRRDGVGLMTTRERLVTSYGDAASLTLRAADEGGVETIVELPIASAA